MESVELGVQPGMKITDVYQKEFRSSIFAVIAMDNFKHVVEGYLLNNVSLVEFLGLKVDSASLIYSQKGTEIEIRCGEKVARIYPRKWTKELYMETGDCGTLAWRYTVNPKYDTRDALPRYEQPTGEIEEMTREEALKEALEIVKAQASVRAMSAEEMTGMVENVARGIMSLDGPAIPEGFTESPSHGPHGSVVHMAGGKAVDPKKAIKETSVTCLECGKAFKIITKKHLASHDLTPDEYRAKWGMKKGVALACKALVRERRKKMKDMKLWEKRGAAKPGA